MAYYTIAAPGVSIAQNKALIGIYNGVGSNKIIKVTRIWMLNNQTTAVTGVNLVMQIVRITTGSGGFAIAPLKHDSADAAIPSQIASAVNMTYTTDVIIRRFWWSSDEPVASGTQSQDEIQTVPSLMIVWDSDWYMQGNTTVEPIVLREGYGLAIINTTASSVGVVDTFFEVEVI